MDFLYDEAGDLLGFKYDGSSYYYIRNLQSDITGILNGAGEQIVSYAYDAWGKLLSVTGSSADTIGEKNPFRYRGYYYDTETGLYYLNSRYYDPEIGRFINPDAIAVLSGDITTYNVFAYCNNNPVNKADSSGNFAVSIALILITVVATVYAYSSAKANYRPLAGAVANGLSRFAENIKEKSKFAEKVRSVAETTNIDHKDTYNHSIYVLKDQSAKVKYVGRTNNTKRREYEHHNDIKHPERKTYRMSVVATGLNRDSARSMEQTFIAAYSISYLDNARNEIAKGRIAKAWEKTGDFLVLFWDSTEDEILRTLKGE